MTDVCACCGTVLLPETPPLCETCVGFTQYTDGSSECEVHKDPAPVTRAKTVYPFDVLLTRVQFSMPLAVPADAEFSRRDLVRLLDTFDFEDLSASSRHIELVGRGRVGIVEVIEFKDEKSWNLIASGHLSGLHIPRGSWVELVPMFRWRTTKWIGTAQEKVSVLRLAKRPANAQIAFFGFRLYQR